MHLIKKSVLIFLTYLLASCSSGTGGIIGGLVPAPKFLDGEVTDGIYASPENAFTVRTPYTEKEHYEWSYTQIHEVKDKNVIGIVFGPAAFDKNNYHAVLIRLPINNPDKEEYINALFDKKADERSSLMQKKHEATFRHNDSNAYYAVYEKENSFFIVTLVDQGDYFYVIEADVIKKYSLDKVDIEILKKRSWNRYNRIFNSFTVVNGSYNGT